MPRIAPGTQIYSLTERAFEFQYSAEKKNYGEIKTNDGLWAAEERTLSLGHLRCFVQVSIQPYLNRVLASRQSRLLPTDQGASRTEHSNPDASGHEAALTHSALRTCVSAARTGRTTIGLIER